MYKNKNILGLSITIINLIIKTLKYNMIEQHTSHLHVFEIYQNISQDRTNALEKLSLSWCYSWNQLFFQRKMEISSEPSLSPITLQLYQL